MVITVVGATGLIGRRVVDLLSGSGTAVRAITRDAARATPLPGVVWAQADLREPILLEPALAGTSVLFLLTDNQLGFGDLQVAVVRAAQDLGVQHIVKESGLGASDHSASWIGREHWNVEQVIKQSPASTWTILRPHSFMQNWLVDHAESVRSEGRIYSPIEDGRVPFIDARDIADVAAEVLQHPTDHVNVTYVLTGGEAIGFADIADALTEATGRHVDYVRISMEDAAQRYREAGAGEESIKAVLALAEYQRDGGKTAEVSPKVEEILGRPPRTVREFALDYRERFQ